MHALDRKQTAFRRGYDPSLPKELYQIADVLVRDRHIAYRLRDLQGNQLLSAYYYPEFSKTIFPYKCSISRETPQRQFTDALDVERTKYRLIKIQEYQQPIWILDKTIAGTICQSKMHKYYFKCSIYTLVELYLTLPTNDDGRHQGIRRRQQQQVLLHSNVKYNCWKYKF